MARTVVREYVDVCDSCGSSDDVLRRGIRLVEQDRRFSIDLCGKCRRTLTLEDIAGMTYRTPGGRTRVRKPVVSKSQIAARKRAAKKNTPSK